VQENAVLYTLSIQPYWNVLENTENYSIIGPGEMYRKRKKTTVSYAVCLSGPG